MANKIRRPLLVIVGETASGKSYLSLSLAERFNGEIICADSATVRRGADIGTAKPSKEDQKKVTHHMINIVEPDERFTVAEFQRLAYLAIDDISSRGKLPIMVGGTGLYIDSVLYGYSFLPFSDHSELDQLSLEELLKKAEDMGLDLSTIDSQNKRRLVRFIQTDGATPTKNNLREDALVLGIKIDKEVLADNIDKRIDLMLAEGLEGEVKSLIPYGWGSEVLKTVGYSQWQGYFEGEQSIAETKELIQKASLNLAKRQRTWFKRNKSIHWLDTPVDLAKVVDEVTTFLSN